MASGILGWSKHASRMVRFNGMNLLSSPPPKLFRDIYEGGVLQRGYMTLDSRVIGGYCSNASRARDYSSDGLDVNTNANTMIYGKTYSSVEEKRSSFKVCQDNNAFLTQQNQMYRSCTHCPNCLDRVAHNQFPSYCDELPSPPPPEVNCRKSAAEFCRGPKHPVGELTEEMRKKFSKSYEEDCPSATAFHTQHNQICRSCTHCPNCFAHVAHHQLLSYCCKLPLAPPPEGNSKNSAAKFFTGYRRPVGGRGRQLETRFIRRQSDEGIALATKLSERFGNWCETYPSEEEKPVLSIARSWGKGILVGKKMQKKVIELKKSGMKK